MAERELCLITCAIHADDLGRRTTAQVLIHLSHGHGEQKERDVLAQQRQEMHDIFQAANQGASSSRNVNNFHKATETLERAAQVASRKHKLSVGDTQLRTLWIMARGSVAESQTIEAEAGSAGAGLQLLSAVADEYRALLIEIAESANPKVVGVIQRDLGQTLRQESVQSGGDQSLKFMQQAIAELRASVKTFEDFGDPVDAADAKEQLASALTVYSSLVSGPRRSNPSMKLGRSCVRKVLTLATKPRIMASHDIACDDIMESLALTEPVLLVLLSLAEQPRHGYSILKDVERMSSGRVMLSTGTLYGALRRLLDQDWIERFEEDESLRDRRAYRLTSLGRRHLQLEVERMRHLTKLASLRIARKEA